MAAAATLALDAPPWLLRPYDPSTDEDGLMYLLGVGYTRTRAGERAGASHAGGSRTAAERVSGAKRDPAALDRQKAFVDAHRFVWLWLLANAEVTLAVDSEKPATQIWGWLATSGDVIHAVGCKRSLIAEKLSTDVARDLLGDRLRKHQVCSLELPQMRTRGSEAIGLDRPSSWSLDPTWLLTRIPRGTTALASGVVKP